MERLYEIKRSVLESVSGEIVVLDRDGRIVAVNEAWTRSARREAIPQERTPVGSDYFAAIERAVADGSVEVHQLQDVLRAVRTVLAGERSSGFQTTYRYGPPDRLRHYLLTVSPRAGGEGAVVVHTDVTELEEAKAALEGSLREVRELKERLEAENVVLQQEVRHAHGFEEIVGTSPALGRVLAQVEQVAPTDAPVLLLGETGTGKDLVARAIHEPQSAARARPLVTVNCAALPATLVESELFGYEKGAFTGALAAHPRPLRGGRRRHALPRRDRRAAARGPGQAAARAADRRVRAARLVEDDPGRRAPDRRHQPRPRARGARRAASAPTSSTA